MTTHTGHKCSLHFYHSPRVTDCDWHHTLPLEFGGQETPENRVPVCQTGHRSVHVLFSQYVEYQGTPPWPIRREFGPGEREIAAEGWRRFVSSMSSDVEPTHDVERTAATGKENLPDVATSEQQP